MTFLFWCTSLILDWRPICVWTIIVYILIFNKTRMLHVRFIGDDIDTIAGFPMLMDWFGLNPIAHLLRLLSYASSIVLSVELFAFKRWQRSTTVRQRMLSTASRADNGYRINDLPWYVLNYSVYGERPSSMTTYGKIFWIALHR